MSNRAIPPVNVYLFILLRFLVIRKLRGDCSDQLGGEDFKDIAEKIYGSRRQTGFLTRWVFQKNARLNYRIVTLNDLIKFLTPEFSYTKFNEFAKANLDEFSRKYSNSNKNHIDDFASELDEIKERAKDRCNELFRKLREIPANADVANARVLDLLDNGYFNYSAKIEKLIRKSIDNNEFHLYDTHKESTRVWAEFTNDFKSYNDTWKMELEYWPNYIQLHIERYKDDPRCASFHFLFFLLDGFLFFERFIKFQAMVHFRVDERDINDPKKFRKILENKLKKTLPSTLKHLTVYLNNMLRPQGTFFRGYKENSNGETTKYSILYISMPGYDRAPFLIGETSSADVWCELNAIWDRACKDSLKLTGRDIFQTYLDLLKKYDKNI